MREKEIKQTPVKAMGGMSMDPYENLANAIIIHSVNDYRKALHILKTNPGYEPAQYTVKEAERFFRSDWYTELTTLCGESLIKKLQQEAV